MPEQYKLKNQYFKEEHVLLVAKWWADQLRLKKTSPESKLDTREGKLSDMLRLKMTPTAEKIDHFERTLAEILRNAIHPPMSVDYHAQGYIKQAADEVGINDMSFPWKTSMYMFYDHATVSRDGERTLLYDEREKDEANEMAREPDVSRE